ncbi:hypothetical protein PHMEG_00031276 [Phytophthora megakarya]|uniref:Serine protease n=1 Tax=Phytophthora megakarya TaxID=4795 RepID=A0A225UZR5_9STRA|nr:hypothetical protein PHMEG_00031276 [Phytophthora megakarya]
MVEGGPGSSSTGMEFFMEELHSKLEGTTNVYTMDHRGSGRSTFLKCAGSSNTSELGDEIILTEIPACAQELEKKYGDLASFSITSATTDLVKIMSKYSNGASTIVYGAGYGTVVVERLMHLDPPGVTGYVLDSITTTSGGIKNYYLSELDTNAGEVGDHFLDLCKTDEFCSSHFESVSLRSMVQAVIKTFDTKPKSKCAALMSTVKNDEPNVSNEPPSFTIRRFLGQLMGDSIQRTFIAPVVYRLHRCESEDISVLTNFIERINLFRSRDINQENAYWSSALYYLILYSEMWEIPTPSKSEMLERFKSVRMSGSGDYWLSAHYCAFSKDKSDPCAELDVGNYKAHGIIYERDEYWNKSATIPNQASVLLLNGKLDPVTPNKYAKYLLDALQGDKKELISFDYAASGAVASAYLDELDETKGTCGVELLASYVKNKGDLKRLDKSCTTQMPEFNLTVPTAHLHSYFRTTDAFDGDYDDTLAQP